MLPMPVHSQEIDTICAGSRRQKKIEVGKGTTQQLAKQHLQNLRSPQIEELAFCSMLSPTRSVH